MEATASSGAKPIMAMLDAPTPAAPNLRNWRRDTLTVMGISLVVMVGKPTDPVDCPAHWGFRSCARPVPAGEPLMASPAVIEHRSAITGVEPASLPGRRQHKFSR